MGTPAHKNTIEGKLDSLIKEHKKMNELLSAMMSSYIVMEGYKNGIYSRDFTIEMLGMITKNSKQIVER